MCSLHRQGDAIPCLHNCSCAYAMAIITDSASGIPPCCFAQLSTDSFHRPLPSVIFVLVLTPAQTHTFTSAVSGTFPMDFNKRHCCWPCLDWFGPVADRFRHKICVVRLLKRDLTVWMPRSVNSGDSCRQNIALLHTILPLLFCTGPGHLMLTLRAVSRLDLHAWEIKETEGFDNWIMSFLVVSNLKLLAYRGDELVGTIHYFGALKYKPPDGYMTPFGDALLDKLPTLGADLLSKVVLGFASMRYKPSPELLKAYYSQVSPICACWNGWGVLTKGQRGLMVTWGANLVR